VAKRGEQPITQYFDNRAAQVTGAAVAGLFVLIGFAGVMKPPSRAEGAIFIAFGAFSFCRALRTSCVIVDKSGVSTRSMVRTRRYNFSNLRGVEVVVDRTGFVGSVREHLLFHRIDGVDVAFKELSCPVPRIPVETSVVRRAAASINDRLRNAGG